jgi:nucleoside 2-deoxyribosyltransferase
VVRIFLSHSSRDESIVEPIRAQANAFDVDVYLHELHPEPGATLSAKITAAIQASDALVVLITPNTVTSAYVNQEIGYALGQSLPVIPLVAPGVTNDQLAMLEGVEYVAFDPDHPHKALTHLTARLHVMQAAKVAVADTAKQAEVQMALRRQQELAVALGFICVLLFLYIAASGDGPGKP